MNIIKPVLLTLISIFMLSSHTSYAIDVFPTSLEELKTLNNDQLNTLYRYGTAFDVPSANTPGVTLMHEGVPLPTPGFPGPSELLNFFWGGKAFYTDALGNTSLTNKILPTTPISFMDVSAEVYFQDHSLTGDGMPVITLDYAHSNIAIAQWIRDEIRLIAPDLYLGRAYIKNGFLTRLLTGKEYTFALWFALQAP